MIGEKNSFSYGYLTNSHLPESLSMPNNMTLTRAYEEKRDLTTAMTYKRAATTVVNRGYTYDALAHPITRTTARKGSARNDAFTYNSRSELTAATLGTDGYGYGYDNIGNRKTAQELADELTYASNNLNQYTGITRGEETPFVPAYDANGNQTLVKTATGLWTVQYDANNRPVSFTKTEGETTTVVECGYDYLGRRYMKKVTVNGTVTLYHRYLYRGYLQIACCDLTRAAHPCLWLITWDPTEPVATRPLALQKDGTWYCYGLDITKNVWELFGPSGYIRTAYDYTPYGGVTEDGDVTQPIQWSSEMYDAELAIVYYNYRHYNPMDGRWINRDPIAEEGGWNLYAFLSNSPFYKYDSLGMWSKVEGREDTWCAEKNDKTLSSLATEKYHAHEDDAACIWPVGNTQGDDYPNMVQPGDIYDASNLKQTCAENVVSIETASDLKNGHEQAYGRSLTFIAGSTLAAHIRDKSKKGASPITDLFVGGHGAYYVGGVVMAGIGPHNGVGSDYFNSNQLFNLNQPPTFTRAKQKKGPIRCWFCRKSVVRFVGCTTNPLAARFAQGILRKSSISWGTMHTIRHSQKWYFEWQLEYESPKGSNQWHGQGRGAKPTQSATWFKYAGIL